MYLTELYSIHASRPAAVQIHDTHSQDPVQQPAGLVDCSLLASDMRRWSCMVVPIECEPEDTDLVTALGKLVKHMQHAFHQQPERQQLFAAIITMRSMEVLRFSKQLNAPVKL